MELRKATLERRKRIYIPICFYLNQNIPPSPSQIRRYLHSNMFLLKLCQGLLQEVRLIYLHSNMFLLKSLAVFTVIPPIPHLHSNMFLLKFF